MKDIVVEDKCEPRLWGHGNVLELRVSANSAGVQVDHEREEAFVPIRPAVTAVGVRCEPLARSVTIETESLIQPNCQATIQNGWNVSDNA